MRLPAAMLLRSAVGVILAFWLAVPAFAQIGIGVGNIFWGPGFGGFFGRGGGVGSYGGFGAIVAPRAVYQQPRFYTKPHSEKPAQGRVQGTLNTCPTSSERKQCPIPMDLLRQVVINAIPQGDNQPASQQWISTQPNEQGYYQFNLQPGKYILSVSTPLSDEQAPRREKVTVRAGQTIEKDLRIQE